MAIFNSYVKLPEGMLLSGYDQQFAMERSTHFY